MKYHPNEKQQDLLLDALSCIDEDILERGLALREQAAPQEVPLLALTDQRRSANTQGLWRRTLVVAAALALLAAIPLSMWLVSKQASYGDAPAFPSVGETGKQDGQISNGESPMDPLESMSGPTCGGEVQEPGDSLGGIAGGTTGDIDDNEMEEPVATAPEGIPQDPTESPELDDFPLPVWSTISNRNGDVEYELVGSGLPFQAVMTLSAQVNTVTGRDEDVEEFHALTVSATDEYALKTIGQWYYSIYFFDYHAHFSLFHPDVVQERFVSEMEKNGKSYRQAIEQIQGLSLDLPSFEQIKLVLSLTENTLLSEDALSAYREELALRLPDHMDLTRLTAARRMRVEGSILLDGTFCIQALGCNTFTCYEYDGQWYLDPTFLDDDLSIDLALSDTHDGLGLFREKEMVCQITGKGNGYLITDSGYAFNAKDAVVELQTDNGEWYDFGYDQLPTMGTVRVTYYDFSLEQIRLLEGDEPTAQSITLCRATTIRWIG